MKTLHCVEMFIHKAPFSEIQTQDGQIFHETDFHRQGIILTSEAQSNVESGLYDAQHTKAEEK